MLQLNANGMFLWSSPVERALTVEMIEAGHDVTLRWEQEARIMSVLNDDQIEHFHETGEFEMSHEQYREITQGGRFPAVLN